MAQTLKWVKGIAAGAVIIIGGPALMEYVRPTPEELLSRMSPEDRARALEEGPRRAQEFDDYVTNLKRWSKSDKSIWVAAQEEVDARKAQMEADRAREKAAMRAQQDEMRKEMQGDK